MKRFFSLLGALVLGLIAIGPGVSPASAQMNDAKPAFSNATIGSFELPTLVADGGANGFTFSATEASAGKLHVVLESEPGIATYLDFMQVPAGLDDATAIEQALLMAREDVPTEGWVYAGGSYAVDGASVEFIVNLSPGTWHLAASYQPDGGEETMTLSPFTVTDGTPVTDDALVADVSVELQDVTFGISSETVASGPHIWHFSNTGDQPRQVVLVNTARLMSPDDFIAMFSAMIAGTPTADMAAMIWVGYVAVLSPGQDAWVEFDFAPGTYALTSFVVDPATQMPAIMQGMSHGFTVE